jgi:hypothetical protein
MKAARSQQMNSIFTTWNQTVLGGAKRDFPNTAILEGVTRLPQLRSRVFNLLILLRAHQSGRAAGGSSLPRIA